MRGLDKIRLTATALLLVFTLQAGATTAELQKAMRAATFEVVMKKPEKDPLGYEKPLPLELLPYMERTDLYRSIGTAFSLGHNTYVTAGHVLNAGINSQFGPPALRNADGKVFAIDQIIKYSVHEDFAVFTVVGDPASQGLPVNRSPQINDSVFAVGNALGDGVVIRDGLYTSDTPEEQDGRWKWIRFSAPASPGNSGGPLIDTTGAVIGIVIGKSPNENLNYSLPISRVLDAPANKALFDTRYLQSLPYLHGTMTHSLKTEFALPKNWESFSSTYVQLTDRDVKQSRQELLSKYSSGYFPANADEVLYDDDHKFDPQLIMQQADGRWESESARFKTTDLPVDGFIKVGSANNVSLFRLHRPNESTDAAFYRDSKAFMDMALKGLDIKRQVGSDAVQVTSLGAALRENRISDKYGRVWQQRIWPIPYLDAYVVAMMLPTPDGYVGFLEYTPSAILNGVVSSSENMADLIDISYWGSLEQWQSYLKQRDLVPQSLAKLQLDVRDSGNSLKISSSRTLLDISSKLLKTGNRSPLGIDMNYSPEAGQLSWNINSIWLYTDLQKRAYVALTRHPKPLPTLKRSYQDNWENLTNRRSPYDAKLSRETAETWSAITVITVPSTITGKISDSLMYSAKVAVEDYIPPNEMKERLKLAQDAVQIVEKGSGALADTGALSNADSGKMADLKEQVENLRSKLPEISRGSFIPENDKTMRDIRNRMPTDDMHDYALSASDLSRIRSIGDAFDKAYAAHKLADAQDQLDALQSIAEAVKTRVLTISSYWQNVKNIERERRMWQHALERDHWPADTAHARRVTDAEMQLKTAVTSGTPVSETWKSPMNDLLSALIADRNSLARRAGSDKIRIESVEYRPRQTACPDPRPVVSKGEVPVAIAIPGYPADKPVNSQTTANTSKRAMIRGPIPDIDEHYPSRSKRDGEEGVVVLSLKIDSNGCPSSAGVSGSSGSDALDAAALEFAELLAYDPATMDGKPAASVQPLAITFVLRDKK